MGNFRDPDWMVAELPHCADQVSGHTLEPTLHQENSPSAQISLDSIPYLCSTLRESGWHMSKNLAAATPTSLRGRLTPQEVRAKIHEICESNNYDPFEELIKLATETQEVEVNGHMHQIPVCDVDQRITIARELAQYMAPKLKSVEVTAEIDNQFTFNIKHFNENGEVLEIPSTPATQAVMRNSLQASRKLVDMVVEDEEKEDNHA